MRSPTPSAGYSWKGPLGLLAIVMALTVTSCGEDSPTEPKKPDPPPPVPVVSGYSESTVQADDTLVVNGSGFLNEASRNVIGFANSLAQATPLSASTTSLTVVVPINAATGPVTVTISGQPTAGVGPGLEVTRVLGEVWRYGQSGAEGMLRLPQPGSQSEYLLIPHATAARAAPTEEHTYTISNDEASSFPAPPLAQTVSPSPQPTRGFERHLREEFERITSGARGAEGGHPFSSSKASAQPDSIRTFNVLNTAHPDADLALAVSYDQVVAKLRYVGQHCLVYSDTDTLQSGNLTDAHFELFGERFDDPADGIHKTNTGYFGTESDVDGNGKVIVLISGIINHLPWTDPGWHDLLDDEKYFIGGFFSQVDLLKVGQYGIEQGTTNYAEIFYMLAADPDGQYLGSDFKFSVEMVAQENILTLAHEYEHLISYSHRYFTYGTAYIQQTWLEEGMAHMAEDLNLLNSGNVERANDYLEDPGAVSLEYDAAPLNQRGGIYLFLRYMGDRFGDSIYRQLLQSKCVGRACVEAITGEDFYDTLGDFLAALYLSGKEIASDGRFDFPSLDGGGYEAVAASRHTVGVGQVSGTIRRASGDFILFTNTDSAASHFTFTESARAGLRTIVVRTK
jgi:hypothetical protein